MRRDLAQLPHFCRLFIEYHRDMSGKQLEHRMAGHLTRDAVLAFLIIFEICTLV